MDNEKLIYIMIGVFLVSWVVSVICLLVMKPTIPVSQKKYNLTVEKSKAVLKSSVSPKIKSKAFTQLILCSYVLINVLINTGNKYDDEKQTKHFCSSLTFEDIKKIENLEAEYANCSF